MDIQEATIGGQRWEVEASEIFLVKQHPKSQQHPRSHHKGATGRVRTVSSSEVPELCQKNLVENCYFYLLLRIRSVLLCILLSSNNV